MQTLVKVLIGSLVVSLAAGIAIAILAGTAKPGQGQNITAGMIAAMAVGGVAGTVTMVALIMWVVERLKQPA